MYRMRDEERGQAMSEMGGKPHKIAKNSKENALECKRNWKQWKKWESRAEWSRKEDLMAAGREKKP